MKAMLLAALAALSLQASASQDWTLGDSVGEAAFLALMACDRAQTHAIQAQFPGGRGDLEINPILGPHPSKRAIDNYFAVASAAHLGLAIALPHNHGRRSFQIATIALEVWTVGQNASVGIRVGF